MCQHCKQAEADFARMLVDTLFQGANQTQPTHMAKDVEGALDTIGAYILTRAEQRAAKDLGVSQAETLDALSVWNAKLIPRLQGEGGILDQTQGLISEAIAKIIETMTEHIKAEAGE